MNILGMEIKSNEDREKEEREYLVRIFPGGEAQKEAVVRELQEAFPKEKVQSLLYYYIMVRDTMLSNSGMSCEEAILRVAEGSRLIKVTPQLADMITQLIPRYSIEN